MLHGNKLRILIPVVCFILGFILGSGMNKKILEENDKIHLMLSSSVGSITLSQIELVKEDNGILFKTKLDISCNQDIANLINSNAVDPIYNTVLSADVYDINGVCHPLENLNDDNIKLDFSNEESFELEFFLNDSLVENTDNLYDLLDLLQSMNVSFSYQDPNSFDLSVLVSSHVFQSNNQDEYIEGLE